MRELSILQQQMVECERCPRLREHCRDVAVTKRRAYMDWEYWGKPVPSFGDPQARVLILGLAPGAHGANRTGRMFTGDSSGDFLYRVLYETGFATQPTSVSSQDGLALVDAYITASAHCAPPDNKPSKEELANCRPYLEHELALLPNVQIIVALRRIAFDTYLSLAGIRNAAHTFAHGAVHHVGEGFPILISSYHPSQQNTSTGKLTHAMLLATFQEARDLLADRSPPALRKSR